MEDFPEVRRCCGVFPIKHATYLISVFGMGCGGVGIAGLVLYSLIDNSTMSRKTDDADQAKKISLTVVGISSLLLVVSCLLLFCGILGKGSAPMLSLAIFIILIMCGVCVFAAIAPPMACFFAPKKCPISSRSYSAIVLLGMVLTGFVSAWVYFAVVVGNQVLNI